MKFMTALLALMALSTGAHAAVVATAASPGGVIAVSVSLDNDGRPSYAVTRGGKPVIADSRLGFLFTDAPKMERNFTFVDQTSGDKDESWEQPWGEWRTIRDRHRELRVRLKEKSALGREMSIVFRLFDDGIGFRYELPGQPNLRTANIAEELTEFAVAEPATAWWLPAFEWNREEYLYNTTPLSEVGTAQSPMTLRLASGLHLAIHEAALVDYSGFTLAKVEGNRLRTVLTPGAGAPKVTRTAPFATPWRTVIIVPDAPSLYHSHIELNLNEPNKLGDVSWLKPGKFMGIWWGMFTDRFTWARGPKHGATTANTKRYIDAAARYGIPNLLVEGWNPGWDGDWFGNGNDFDFARPTEDFDIDFLAKYGARKGVNLIGHHETGGSVSHYDAQLDRAFAFAAAHGERVVKTGYVTDAGQIERVDPDGTRKREWHEGQWMSNHFVRVLEAAAKHRVGIDSHEPIKNTGLRRTYPNWLSGEGARGMEYNAFGQPKNPPEHEVNLVFTRMLAGPMDYTPGIVSLEGNHGEPIPSTLARQLALYVVLYSPVVMLADVPESYAKVPAAMPFLRAVPTDWEDTRVLAGAVGDLAVIARKERGGADWYLGAITDEQARTAEVSLDFLDSGKTYQAEIYRDGEGADFRQDTRHAMAVERRTVRRGDRLSLALAPGGGTAIRLVAGRR